MFCTHCVATVLAMVGVWILAAFGGSILSLFDFAKSRVSGNVSKRKW